MTEPRCDPALQAPDGDAPAPGLRADPSARLTEAFRAVAARMDGLPIVNPALAVEAVGFAPWQGHWLGVMLTPWFMNLVIAPGDESAWQPLPPGARRSHAFPAGAYEFIGARDEIAGEFQMCSLFSPVLRAVLWVSGCAGSGGSECVPGGVDEVVPRPVTGKP